MMVQLVRSRQLVVVAKITHGDIRRADRDHNRQLDFHEFVLMQLRRPGRHHSKPLFNLPETATHLSQSMASPSETWHKQGARTERGDASPCSGAFDSQLQCRCAPDFTPPQPPQQRRPHAFHRAQMLPTSVINSHAGPPAFTSAAAGGSDAGRVGRMARAAPELTSDEVRDARRLFAQADVDV